MLILGSVLGAGYALTGQSDHTQSPLNVTRPREANTHHDDRCSVEEYRGTKRSSVLVPAVCNEEEVFPIAKCEQSRRVGVVTSVAYPYQGSLVMAVFAHFVWNLRTRLRFKSPFRLTDDYTLSLRRMGRSMDHGMR